MIEVIYYKCENCEHIWETKELIEKCFTCRKEICPSCGCIDYFDNTFVCEKCLGESK